MKLFGKRRTDAPTRGKTQRTLELLTGIGKVMAHASVYGGTHKLTQQALQESYAALSGLLEAHKRVNLTIVGKELQIDGEQAEPRNRFVHTFIEKLTELR